MFMHTGSTVAAQRCDSLLMSDVGQEVNDIFYQRKNTTLKNYRTESLSAVTV